MHNYNRDIILLLKEQRIYRHDIEVKKLHALIASVEKIEVFCTVHELVVRNRITQKKFRIAEVMRTPALKPFYFLINKN